MKLAFYKGKGTLRSKLIRLTSKGPYSHCELVFSDGMCGTSCMDSGGIVVRFLHLDPKDWDLIEISGDEEQARRWFENHKGEKYDYLGLFHHMWGKVRGIHGRWICSEAIMASLGYRDSWSFNPNSVASLFKGPTFNVLEK